MLADRISSTTDAPNVERKGRGKETLCELAAPQRPPHVEEGKKQRRRRRAQKAVDFADWKEPSGREKTNKGVKENIPSQKPEGQTRKVRTGDAALVDLKRAPAVSYEV